MIDIEGYANKKVAGRPGQGPSVLGSTVIFAPCTALEISVPTCGLHLTMLKEPEPRSATCLQRWLNSCTLAGMCPATTQKQVPLRFQATS